MAKRGRGAGATSPCLAPRARLRVSPPSATSKSSALVAALLERSADARSAVRAAGRRVTSALTLAETARAILRARVAGRTADQERSAIRALRRFERRCYVVAVTDTVLGRVAGRFPIEPVRTLDAVHLATAALLGEPAALVTIVTRDERVRANAEALGFPSSKRPKVG